MGRIGVLAARGQGRLGSACSLLKWEQLTLCALGALWSKCFRVIGVHRQPLQYFESKFFRNLLEACAASAYATLHHDCPVLEPPAE
jgi:hypothetical protein